MTIEQVDSLRLGIHPIDNRVVLIIESGLEWLKNNTKYEFDINDEELSKALPASVRLFLTKFYDVNTLSMGIASQGIEGLSQSFTNEDINNLIWQAAEELIPRSHLKSRIRFVTAKKRWN